MDTSFCKPDPREERARELKQKPGIINFHGWTIEELEQILGPEMPVADMVSFIGWTQEEFVEACIDYEPDKEDYDWHKVLKSLWEQTYNRIHSYLDLRHKFRYYNDWKYIIDFALALNKIRLIDPLRTSVYITHLVSSNTNGEDNITLKELEEDLKKRNKAVLPNNQLEKEVVWALISLILQLHNYMYVFPEQAYEQISGMRQYVANKEHLAEEKREQRREKKQVQKKRKNKRKGRK